MKKVVFVSILLISFFNAFSQVDNKVDIKRMKYGFNLGLNYPNLLDDNKLPDNASISNNIGFRLGIIADYKISEILSFSPKAELSLNSSKVIFSNSDDSQTEYDIMPISMEFMAFAVFKNNNKKYNLYFFIGPDIKIPISEKPASSTTFSTNSDIAIDFGIGIDKAFTYFNFAPELRYSFGLRNINENPALQSLYFHNISLLFNFIG